MKLSLLAASTVLMCFAGAPQSADAGNFVLSIGGRNGGFGYGPVYRPAYGGYYGNPYGYNNFGYRNVGYQNVGYRGGYYGNPYYGNRGFSNRSYYSPGRNRGGVFFDRGDQRRLQRNVRRVIRRW